MTDFIDAMGQLMTSHGAAKVSFTIRGTKIIPGMFAKLKKVMRIKGRVFIKFDDDTLARAEVDAMYRPWPNQFVFPESMQNKTFLNASEQRMVFHECFHAILDMERVKGISMAEEETAAYIAQSIFSDNQFGDESSPGWKEYNRLLAKITADPSYDIAEDDDFKIIKDYVVTKKMGKKASWGTTEYVHDGI